MDIMILKSFIPEIFLSLCILIQLLVNARLVNTLKNNFPLLNKELYFQVFFILFCTSILILNTDIEGFFFNCLFVNDSSTKIIKLFVVLVSLLSLKIISESFAFQKINFFEFFTLFLLSILSFLLMVSSYDLISLYLIIEMQALCFYVLASIKRDSAFSTEAGLKYFISGAFISGFYLFGCSLLYGALGTLNMNAISLLLFRNVSFYNNELDFLCYIGITLVTITLLFKISCAPFHFWSPDVYEGSPLASTVVFSILPKISMLFFFIKWIICINSSFSQINNFLLIIGLTSTFVGTFFALSQKRMKRLIIYSSIAQTGFIVCSLAIGDLNGFSAMYFFLLIYVITSILMWGHFSVFYVFQKRVSSFSNENGTSLFLSSFANLFKYHGIWAFSFVVIFFSIGGIPPFTGFLSKIIILLELVKIDALISAIMLILISSVSVYYYIRIVKVLFFEPKEYDNSQKFQVIFYNKNLDSIYMIFSICTFVLIVTFFYPNLCYLLCEYLLLGINLY
jgi:NADH-quinone oxidoreductase subunit N